MSDCMGCGLTKEYREQLRERIEKHNSDFILSAFDALTLLRQGDELEKEADWLISEKIVEEWNGRFVGAFNADKGGLVVYESQAVAVASWREAARKAVEENHEN